MYIQIIYIKYDNIQHDCLVEAWIPPANVLRGITVIMKIIVEVTLLKGIDIINSEKQNRSNSIIY